MRLLLIRHGETVDNVAGLYAGVRDSTLTNHGVDQAQRLGRYLAESPVKLTHIFSSPLSRALKTAEALQKAQPAQPDASSGSGGLKIVQVPDLIEQDFGFYEGKSFFARSDPKKTGREAHYDKHRDEPGFVDVESRESMARRADAFLDQHLFPLIRGEAEDDAMVVAVVSHGILLSNLWRRLLLRLPRKSLSIAPEVTAMRDNLVLEHLGGWSNTGYLELSLQRPPEAVPLKDECTSIQNEADQNQTYVSELSAVASAEPAAKVKARTEQVTLFAKPEDKTLHGWSTRILAIDSKAHLVGLKRQRGGIGRSAHDESQKKLDMFFKRQKTDSPGTARNSPAKPTV